MFSRGCPRRSTGISEGFIGVFWFQGVSGAFLGCMKGFQGVPAAFQGTSGGFMGDSRCFNGLQGV